MKRKWFLMMAREMLVGKPYTEDEIERCADYYFNAQYPLVMHSSNFSFIANCRPGREMSQPASSLLRAVRDVQDQQVRFFAFYCFPKSNSFYRRMTKSCVNLTVRFVTICSLISTRLRQLLLSSTVLPSRQLSPSGKWRSHHRKLYPRDRRPSEVSCESSFAFGSKCVAK